MCLSNPAAPSCARPSTPMSSGDASGRGPSGPRGRLLRLGAGLATVALLTSLTVGAGSAVAGAAADTDGAVSLPPAGMLWNSVADGDSPAAPVVGLEADAPPVGLAPTVEGVWTVDRHGHVLAQGAAPTFGDLGDVDLAAPVVGMAATPSGGGYWLVASDGGVFAFGDAVFRGSAGDVDLAAPVVGMAATPSGGGYWLVASDGGVFAFGDARYFGSGTDSGLTGFVAIGGLGAGNGYWLATSGGEVIARGPAGPRAAISGSEELISVLAGSEGARVVAITYRSGEGGFTAAIGSGEVAASEVGNTLTEAEAYVAAMPADLVTKWDTLARCESLGQWDINTGNGFYGGIQFSLRSWQAVGGEGYPHEASREEQIYRGELLRRIQGWGAWPGCRRKLGL